MDINTFDAPLIEEPSILDEVDQSKNEDVCRMRTSLLSCTGDCSSATVNAIRKITATRIHHQLLRIIQYTEMIDRIEQRIYSELDRNMYEYSLSDLMNIQAQLQRTMVESHKLLQPYMDMQDVPIADLFLQADSTQSEPTLSNSEDRDRIRAVAQSIILELQGGANDTDRT